MSDLANENGRAREHGASAGLLEKAVEFDIDVNENAVPPIVETPSKHDPSALDAHAAAGHELIPIVGKAPVAKGWTSGPALSLEAAKKRMAAGRNVGVRLRDTDLVIDVDPRHFNENDHPFDRLKRDFRLDDAPFVVTGGGGFHLYYRKPANVEVAGKLAGYSGIDFKSKGGQVVGAGSVHPKPGGCTRSTTTCFASSLSKRRKRPRLSWTRSGSRISRLMTPSPARSTKSALPNGSASSTWPNTRSRRSGRT